MLLLPEGDGALLWARPPLGLVTCPVAPQDRPHNDVCPGQQAVSKGLTPSRDPGEAPGLWSTLTPEGSGGPGAFVDPVLRQIVVGGDRVARAGGCSGLWGLESERSLSGCRRARAVVLGKSN